MPSIATQILTARRYLKPLIGVKAHRIRLNADQITLLNAIHEMQPVSLGNLAKAMCWDNPTMSRMVAQMVTKGLVSSGPDPDHGRRIRIALTDDGAGLWATNISAQNRDIEARSLEGFDPTEVEAFHELLTKYLANLAVMSASDLPGVPRRMPLAS